VLLSLLKLLEVLVLPGDFVLLPFDVFAGVLDLTTDGLVLLYLVD
jgi:hypothetical protein